MPIALHEGRLYCNLGYHIILPGWPGGWLVDCAATVARVGVSVADTAFDVTASRYVAAIVAEAGIIRGPYKS
ncbi:MAG: hypothetical protein ACLQUY_14615 [Ktedonobacterales bacterium]